MTSSPTPEHLSLIGTAGVVLATIVYSFLAGNNSSTPRTTHPNLKRHEDTIRSQLPNTLHGWRVHTGGDIDEDTHWEALRGVFADKGYILWEREATYHFCTPDATFDVAQNGYAHATSYRGLNENAGGMVKLYTFQLQNHLCHAATAADGRFVVLRVLKVAQEGQRHLDILRYIARGRRSLYHYNHALPLLQEIHFEDITFGVFPCVGQGVREAYNHWAKNSVYDLVDITLQMLEALAAIHSHQIAHLDAFKDNFLIQWQPESLHSGRIGTCRPRVYLHDFEGAVQFPIECPIEQQVLVGIPGGGSWKNYGRPCPPEMAAGVKYDPYKVDVWQLGSSLSDMKTTIPEIDRLLDAMVEPDPAQRKTALELLQELRTSFHAMPPNSLFIAPVVKSELHSTPIEDNAVLRSDQ